MTTRKTTQDPSASAVDLVCRDPLESRPMYTVVRDQDVLLCIDGPKGRMEIATVHRTSEYGGRIPAGKVAKRLAAAWNASRPTEGTPPPFPSILP